MSSRTSIVLCTLNWILWSNLTILFNKWILESTPFHYPILLTTWHLTFATLATQLLFRSLLSTPKNSVRMTPTLYISRIAPIGVLYSASLVCSNTSYMFLNVGFIQMLKASGPVITLLISSLYGLTELTISKVVNVGFITACVGLTVLSEIQFSWMGVFLQFAGLVCDACRLVLMQVLSSPSHHTRGSVDGDGIERDEDEEAGFSPSPSPSLDNDNDNHDDKTTPTTLSSSSSPSRGLTNMNPLLSLYYTAPICALMNAILAWRAEIYPRLQLHHQAQSDTGPPDETNANASLLHIILTTGISTLLLNAAVGFMLNVAVFTLIGKTSGLAMTLVSIPKNILLIFASAGLWGTRVSMVQGIGYAGALAGLVVYAGGDNVTFRGMRWVRRGLKVLGLEKRSENGYG